MPDARYETENWPYIEAKHHGVQRTGTVRLIVIHDMEAPELDKTAENVAQYFATTSVEASAHVCVDNNSVVQCVKDSVVAYAAPGANADGIHIELAGYGWQQPNDWRDKYSLATIAIGADVAAQYCLKYGIPAVRLTDDQLRAGVRGIVGHDQVSRVYQKSDHMDPGKQFPWARFISLVAAMVVERR